MASKDNKQKLVHAAEALVHAALSEVDSGSLIAQKDSVEALKAIRSDMQALKDLAKNQQEHLKAQSALLESHMKFQREQMTLQTEQVKLQVKLQRIEAALRVIAVTPFITFYKGNSQGPPGLVKGILASFWKGQGHYITGYTLDSYNYGSQRNDPKIGEENFQKKLSDHLYNILGVKPRIAPSGNGVAVFYD